MKYLKMDSLRPAEKGSVVLIALATVSAATLVGLYALKAASRQSPDTSAFLAYSTIDMIKSNVQTIMENPDSGSATILGTYGYTSSSNPKYTGSVKNVMECLANQQETCDPGTGYPQEPVVFYMPGPSLYYNGSDPGAGFRLDGTTCTGFNPSNPNDCAIHADISWQPVCLNPLQQCWRSNVKVSLAATFSTTISGFHLNSEMTGAPIRQPDGTAGTTHGHQGSHGHGNGHG